MGVKKKKTKTQLNPEPATKPSMFRSETFGWGLLSVGLLWLSFPPVNWWILAFIAPIGWIRIIRQPEVDCGRPLRCFYVIGFLHWLAMTYWVTLPHWLAAVGWFFLAGYLGIFVVGFLWLARWLVHRNRIAPVFAVPVAWVSMEVLRTYLFTGFGLVPLSHSQVDFLQLIQIASVTGAYGVSFVVVMCATVIDEWVAHFRSPESSPRKYWPSILATSVLISSVAFGYLQLNQELETTGTATVAIVQGSLDTVFGNNSKQRDQAFADYSRMSGDVTSKQKIDLVVWPESMFADSQRIIGITKYDPELGKKKMLADGTTVEEWANFRDVSTMQLVRSYGTKCLMGTGTEHIHATSVDQYNTAAFYDRDGVLLDAYYKMHPVMFGEYIPFGDFMPWLYRLTPIGRGLTPGTEPKSFAVGDIKISPCICFENTVPHLIRRQINDLQQQGESPHALATLTNDGWFWGSALLDVHLACGIFRAVENRRPMLIAANTGISAHVDECGRVLEQSPKRKSRVIVAKVEGRDVSSLHTQFGDWFGGGCVLLSAIGLVVGKWFS